MAVRHAGPVRALPRVSSQAAAAETAPGRVGPITLGMKRTGVRGAGNPRAACDEAEVGNGAKERTEAPDKMVKAFGKQQLPVPVDTAPAFDLTTNHG